MAERCSPAFARLGASPLGTAVHATTWALVTLPLPWPADIADHPWLDGLDAPEGLRVQAIAPAADAAEEIPADRDQLSVLTYRRGEGPYRALERAEHLTAPGELRRVLVDLARGAPPSAADPIEPPAVTGPVVDLAVCTHGTRDRCCGTDGTRLAAELARSLPRHVRLWRTSHTGGHRFAPTALSFPDGRAWAWLDRELATTVALRDRPAGELAGHDRGATGFADPLVQAADAAVLAEVGWAWLEHPREGRVLEAAAASSRAVVEMQGERTWVVELALGEDLPVPVCGEPLEVATKSQRDLRVEAVAPVGG